MKTQRPFDAPRIIEQFHGEKLKGNVLIDFLPNFSEKSVQDMDVLLSWKKFFERKNVPFVVERYKKGHLRMWKIDETTKQ